MKKILFEQSGEGLVALLGERITLFCMNYIYTGILSGVNTDCVLLTDPAIVYETGSFTDARWKNVEELPHDLYVMCASVESFGKVK